MALRYAFCRRPNRGYAFLPLYLMTDVGAFGIEFGAALSGLIVISAWLFRITDAPLALKLTIPSLMLIGGLSAAWQFSALLGRPASTTLASLPEHIELIAFKALDHDKLVDLWIAESGGTRAYEIPLDSKTKQALRQAQGELSQGRPAHLKKPSGKARKVAQGQSYTQPKSDDDNGYEIDVTSSLPPKE